MENSYYIGWWNVENLFDTSEASGRSEKLKRALRVELEGWDLDVLNKKIKQLATVIRFMNSGLGPDLLGVCEVENRTVLQKLVNEIKIDGRDYGIAHHDTKDGRGIDVAFIYDKKLFTAHEQFSYEVLKRFPTRDIFQVNFKTIGSENELIMIGNHWPSRVNGEYESEPYRIVAAETLSYWIKKITEIKGKDALIIVMGDFNDEPHSRSIKDYANATQSLEKVKTSISVPRLYNLMWPLSAVGDTSYYASNFPCMYDQVMASRGLIENGSLQIQKDSIEIVRHPKMQKGKYKIPKRFGRPAKPGFDQDGFSDHFPIGVRVFSKKVY